jgi:hypothetical protein
MNIFKNQITINIVKIIIAILLGLFILVAGSVMVMLIPQPKCWSGPFINHTTMLVLSIIIMLLLSKGKISTYGFKIARDIQIKQIILLSLGIGISANLILSFLPGRGLTFIEERNSSKRNRHNVRPKKILL